MSAPAMLISAIFQTQVEDFQNESRKFGSGCECAIHNFDLSSKLKACAIDTLPEKRLLHIIITTTAFEKMIAAYMAKKTSP